MDKRDLEQLLSDVAGGAVAPAVALTRIQTAPTADLGFAQLDLSRGVRQGAGEVVYGAGKTAEQIAAIIEALRDAGQERILVTRLDAEKAARTSELLGNGIDRALYGYVVDMFELEFMHFAVFNIADIAINVCCILFVLLMLLRKEPEKPKET